MNPSNSLADNTPPDVRRQNRYVAGWLLACCALVFAMVVLGGVTRLTGSGLSIVEWRPLTGVLPPIGDEAWQRTFELYQQSPEFQKINSHMDVHDFKGIFWLEYLHRLLGRTIGVVFLVPFVVFVARGFIRRDEWGKYLLMFVLGGLQGVLGWYMVKSGLIDIPRVSHYRLTAHLVAAFLIFSYMFWVALSRLYPADARSARHPWFRPTLWLTALIGLTVISGGFVAGLRAGKIYNTFPLMGDSLVPPDLIALEPWWRNFLDNIATVQFDHRVLAISTAIAAMVYWLRARRADLPSRARAAATALLGVTALQVTLGITTLLLAVPVFLGATHQGVAMLLFTVALYLLHSLRRA